MVALCLAYAIEYFHIANVGSFCASDEFTRFVPFVNKVGMLGKVVIGQLAVLKSVLERKYGAIPLSNPKLRVSSLSVRAANF